ncbi:MAG: alpha/beta hydrolase [Pseudomonadota bacterium]
MARRGKPAFALVRAGVVALVAPLLAGCNMIEGMFFYPDRVQYTRPADYGLAHEDVTLTTADGVRLHGWWLPAPGAAAGTVLHLHGNAANVSNHLPLAAWLPRAGFNVLMLDYRGFGRSEGRPTLDGVLEDARAALSHLRSRADVDASKLIVFGQSLGGATALRLLAEDAAGVRLAVIDSAFASHRGIARDAALQSIVLAPFLPLALPLLPGADKDPVTALARIAVPLVFVHGRADRVIPFTHSEQLFAAARQPKRLIAVERAGHLEAAMRPDVQSQILAAMREAVR